MLYNKDMKQKKESSHMSQVSKTNTPENQAAIDKYFQEHSKTFLEDNITQCPPALAQGSEATRTLKRHVRKLRLDWERKHR